MKHKKYIAIALTALLTFGSAQTALAAVIPHDISEGNLEISQTTDDTYEVTGSTTTYSIIVKDWVATHIVLNNVKIETTDKSAMDIGSNANVILKLKDESIFTATDSSKAGINVANGTLTITGDSESSLKVTAGDPTGAGAGIGSDSSENFSGTIVIEGGNVEAISGYNGAGIGSGLDGEMSGTITISGGTVIATSDDDGAGIGSGEDGKMSGTINISDGTVIATSGDDGAGIGSGWDGEMSGTITISDGEVTASSNDDGAGIGSGEKGKMSGTITISGGTVIATGEGDGAGIGSGNDGEMSGTGTITISGGEVNASSSYGAGIGSGLNSEMSGKITISDGEVTASSGYDGAGIGSGEKGKMSGTITISGGEVTASSGIDGAGIGSGRDGEMSGTITISDGEVTASSGDYGAGIGSGWVGEMSGTITISGGEVTASSYNYGAGIGAGDSGDITESGSITIGGDAAVTANSTAGLGIGSGDYGNMNGTITITDDAKVDITLGDTSNKTGIGAGKNDHYDHSYEFNGSINILEHANVELKYDDPDFEGTPNIGSSNPDSTGEITLSTGATINGTQASDVEALKALGILNDNAGTTTVEPTPEPENPDSRNTYSLKQLNLVQRINEAEGGEVVAVSEKQLSKGKLPAYALEALAKKENVTLAILCEKFDILIPSEDAVADAGSTQFYTIDELVEMYE